MRLDPELIFVARGKTWKKEKTLDLNFLSTESLALVDRGLEREAIFL